MRLYRYLEKHRYALMLFTLSALILSYPITPGVSGAEIAAFALFNTVLLLSVPIFGLGVSRILIGATLGIPALAASWLPYIVADGGPGSIPTVDAIGRVAMAGFLLFIAREIVRDIFRGREITPEHLSGAISVYLLLGLFFITVGAGIDFGLLFSEPVSILGLALGVMLLKGVILYILGRAFKLRGRDQWLFTLGLAQAGEFGFVLISFSLQQSILPDFLADRLLLIVALTMLITPLAFILYEMLSKRIADGGDDQEHDEIDDQGTVIIAGIGRFGQIVNRLVQSVGAKTVVIDNNLQTIQLMRRFGYKGFFGDPLRPDLLHAAGIEKARVLMVALDDPEAAERLVTYARRIRPDIHIVARARDRTHTYRLYQAGANDIVRELFDSSLRAGRYVLENVGLTEFEASEAEKLFYHHDRYSVSELAQLWDPNVASSENADYIARAKELEKELEASLLAALESNNNDAA